MSKTFIQYFRDSVGTVRPTDVLPPLACIALVFIGYVKVTPFFAWMPFDITLFLAFSVVLLVVVQLVNKRRSLRISPWIVVLFILTIPGWRFLLISDGYARGKFLSMGVTIIVAVATVYLVGTFNRQRSWVNILVGVGFFLLIGITIFPNNSRYWGGVSIEGSNTIASGQMAGVAFIVTFIFVLGLNDSRRYPLAVLSGVFGVLLAMAGSRGSLASAAIAVVIASLLIKTRGRWDKLVLLGVSAMFGALVLTFGGGTGVQRIWLSLVGTEGLISSRVPNWSAAVDAIAKAPLSLGVGWGRFDTVVDPQSQFGRGVVTHPHNLFLELWLEGGVLLALAVAVFIGLSFWRLWKCSHSVYGAAIFAIAVFAFTNSLFTGDVNDNRLLWVVLALGWVLDARLRDSSDQFARREPLNAVFKEVDA